MYKSKIECKICGEILSTNWCKTKFGRWIEIKRLKKKHWHTKAKIMFKEITGIYYSTVEKEWEK